MGSEIQFHVENDVILTAADEEVHTGQVLKYLENNLHKFKMGSKFVLVCGVREDPDGNLFEADRKNVNEHYAMFENFHDHETNNDIVKVVEEKKYKIGDKCLPGLDFGFFRSFFFAIIQTIEF